MEAIAADDRPLDDLSRHTKRLALVVYLACARPRGFHRRDKLAALFWPELPDERARAALRTTLSRLRDDLGADLVVTRSAEEVALDMSGLSCDALAVEAALAAGDALGAAERLVGPFLDGVHVDGVAEAFESWVDEERTRLHREVVQALVQAAHRERDAGRLDAAIVRAERATALAPLDEAVARLAIQLHVAVGDRGSASRIYDRLRDKLAREFGIAPSAETASVVEALERSVPRGVPTAAGRSERALRDSRPTSVVTDAMPEGPARLSLAVLVGGAAIATMLATALTMTALRRREGLAASPLAWQPVASHHGTPLHLIGPSVVLDSAEDALLVMFGTETMHPQRLNGRVMRLVGLRGESMTWTTVETEGDRFPAPRWLAAATLDPTRDRVFLHGGAFGSTSPCSSDLWMLGGAGPSQARRWHQVAQRGPRPSARASHRLAFDAATNRLLLHGGNDCFTVHMHDTWIFAFDDSTQRSGEWRLVAVDSTDGAPPQSAGAAVAFDPARARLIRIVPGAGLRATLWTLRDLNAAAAKWQRVDCLDAPTSHFGLAVAVEPSGEVLWAFGGYDDDSRYSRDVWRIDLGRDERAGCRWTRLLTDDYGPPARSDATLAWSGSTRALVLFGGAFQTNSLNDVWRLTP
ncbi:BTAD domain-containing putative transcriptional regulator [Pseudogemmatithrix spongiicola]|uniref:BTAD domain-containing putative transcriptional regulator n=1 Tax=Pseudogemmatithrix spongiicola TaxID=3062599 RepID=A0AA49Q5L2_9BACT|nr:BTAD domain-containing putative transcriptional regulator [Gemmatimonadaceae bacterium 'strain 138']WKW16255.1 BTAD domain-containing putative transcriptional regulator [Gemmatimonadaceae bacterium 'strain 318']